MRIHTSDKFIAWSTLVSGLTVSAVAIYYSVAKTELESSTVFYPSLSVSSDCHIDADYQHGYFWLLV